MYFIFNDLKYKIERLKNDLRFIKETLKDTNNFLKYAKQYNYQQTIISWEFKKTFQEHQINYYSKLIKELETVVGSFDNVIKSNPEYLREFLDDQKRALRIEKKITKNEK